MAVLVVMAFHYGVPLPGGFTGVDVFFVISGYLITSHLRQEISAGSFSLAAFYARRMRRIVPALLAMLLCVIIAGRFVLMPPDYKSLGASAGVASIGLSNFYFLSNTGYFDRSSDLLPLLHTWSLAVEEQFYLVWPMLFFLICRIPVGVSRSVCVIFLISMAASFEWSSLDQKAAFYLALPRAWELLCGAMVVFLPRLYGWSSELAPIIGLCLLGIAFTLIDQLHFPGPAALLPCLGAACIIWPHRSPDQPAIGTRLLATLSPIGLISYSLYLYHWPVLVLYRNYIANAQPAPFEALLLAAIAFAISAISYVAIEQPFRHSRSIWTSFTVGGLASAIVFCIAGYLESKDGLPSRLPNYSAAISDLGVMWDWPCDLATISSGLPSTCVFGGRWQTSKHRAVLWGDSNAEHLAPLLEPFAAISDVAVALFTPCPAILGGREATDSIDVLPRYNQQCASQRSALMALLRSSPEIESVIIAASWDILLHRLKEHDKQEAFKQALSELCRQLLEIHKRILIVTTIPQWKTDPIPCATEEGLLRRGCDLDLDKTLRREFEPQSESLQIFKDVANSFSGAVELTIPGERLCSRSRCITSIGGEFIYRDQAHFRRNLHPETRRALSEHIGLSRLFQ
ncbi:acyltransferase [Bradyrhizobium sp. BR 10289]|nr:acyltransferase [Bradyrhizobium sp. BR 10289]